MLQYSLLFLSKRGGVAERFDFLAPDDEVAEGAAEDLTYPTGRQLWCGARQLRTWTASEPEARGT